MIGKVIKSLIGGLGKVYPARAEQGEAPPYIVYHLISNTPTDTKQGASKLDVTRVQIDVFSDDYAEMETLSASIRSTLDRYTGTVSTVNVDKIVFENEVDSFDDDAEYYHRSQDYFIRVKR